MEDSKNNVTYVNAPVPVFSTDHIAMSVVNKDGMAMVQLICGETQLRVPNDKGGEDSSVLPKARLLLHLSFATELCGRLGAVAPQLKATLDKMLRMEEGAQAQS